MPSTKRAASNAAITIDFANCLAGRVGAQHGLPSDVLNRTQSTLESLTQKLSQTRGTGWERWRNLPFDPMRREHTRAVNSLVKKLRPKTQNLIVLGIGGS